MSLRWYLIQSKLNQEEALYDRLLASSFEVYFPQVRVKPVNPRARKMKACFPGYLFVHLDLKTVGPSFLQFTPCSKGLVCSGCEPVSLSDSLLAAVRRRVDELNNAGDPGLPFKARTGKVFCQEDPVRGSNASIDGANLGRERNRWLIELLCQWRPPGELEAPAMTLETV